MIKHLGLLTLFTVALINPLSAAETGAGVQLATPTTHNVMTDMTVPPECLDSGRTICAQLPASSTRQLIYGAACYKLQNKSSHILFVPLRTNLEIEQFLLNAPADQLLRTPCA